MLLLRPTNRTVMVKVMASAAQSWMHERTMLPCVPLDMKGRVNTPRIRRQLMSHVGSNVCRRS